MDIIGTAAYAVFSSTALAAAALVVLGATVFRKRIGHDVFGWHEPDEDGVCKMCGEACSDDEQ